MPNLPFISPSLAHYKIPLPDLIALNDGKRLVVGVAIIVPTHSIRDRDLISSEHSKETANKLLLVQRSATESSFASLYELPGGHADAADGDTTILDAVVRETKEETGLDVREIVGEFKGFEYAAGKSGRITKQVNFVVKVDLGDEVEGGGSEGLRVTLNPEEHQRAVWVSGEEDLVDLGLTGSMKDVVKDALAFL
jgi:8-oxo-dGTP pyrophosphatase MutT (NUDIX family)